MVTKKQIREFIRHQQQLCDKAEMQRQADAVFAAITAMPQWQQARHVMLYYSMPAELPTHKVTDEWMAAGKRIYLPRVNGDEIDLLAYEPGCIKFGGKYNIGEPQGDNLTDPAVLDLVIVPGVAFDRHCNRLGHGKGYYDKFLAKIPHVPTIGVALNYQIADAIPVDAHDRPMDAVVTASGIYFKEP